MNHSTFNKTNQPQPLRGLDSFVAAFFLCMASPLLHKNHINKFAVVVGGVKPNVIILSLMPIVVFKT